MGRLPANLKGKVIPGRKESEATRKEAVEKAQKAQQAKMLNRIAAKKAALEMQQKRMARKEAKGKKDKIDPIKAARALAGNKDSVLIKLFWGAWKIGVKMTQQEKALMKREMWWRRTCVRDRTCVGGCGACNALKDPAFRLPFGAEEKPGTSFKQAGSTLLAAKRFNTADIFGGDAVGLDGISPQRGATAPSSMNQSHSMPSLAKGLTPGSAASNYGFGGVGVSREGLAPLLKGGKWEEASRWGSGKKCWYNRVTGQMTYIDPVHHEAAQVAHLGAAATGHSRHYTEEAHLKHELMAEYRQAQESSHFRDLNDVVSKPAVTALDVGTTSVGRY